MKCQCCGSAIDKNQLEYPEFFLCKECNTVAIELEMSKCEDIEIQ